MSGWIKHVIVTLAALVATSSTCAAYADGPAAAPTTTVTTATEPTIAAATATHVYTALRTKMAREAATGSRVPAITYLPRLRGLNATLRAPMLRSTMAPAPGTQRDADAQVTFWTGADATAACLHLTTGTVTAGRCGFLYEPAPQTLTSAYDTLARTLTWFDRHDDVYGEQARDTALVASVLATDVGEAFTATYLDQDDDGVVDEGRLVLTDEAGCGTVTLPDHDPLGRTYSSTLLHGVC